MKLFDRKLILEDGSVYMGYGFGAKAHRVCEIVFNTSTYRRKVYGTLCNRWYQLGRRG